MTNESEELKVTYVQITSAGKYRSANITIDVGDEEASMDLPPDYEKALVNWLGRKGAGLVDNNSRYSLRLINSLRQIKDALYDYESGEIDLHRFEARLNLILYGGEHE